jgi:hypothetical protein
VTRDLTAIRSNTNKHGICKINITPNIRINCVIIFTRCYEIVGSRIAKFGATVIKL